MPLNKLPEWSKTIDSRHQADWSGLKPAALAFLKMSPEERKSAVAEYGKLYCFPKLDLPKASGLYLLFRVVFDLPLVGMDRSKASAFGGWLHPSIGEPGLYLISWPVEVTHEHGRMSVKIDRYTGYSGKGYDAAGEFDFLRENFKLRDEAALQSMTVR